MSQIWSLMGLLSMVIMRAPNSTPMVRSCTGWKRLSVNCSSRRSSLYRLPCLVPVELTAILFLLIGMSGFLAVVGKIGTFLLWVLFLVLQTATRIVGSPPDFSYDRRLVSARPRHGASS